MSTLVVDRDLNGVPKPIVEKLQSVVKRARLVLLVRGIMAVFSIALLALLVGMAIDSSFTIFSTAIRAVISLSLLAVVLASAYVFLIRPLMRTFDLTGVARIIETRHPELEERISSAVELLTSQDISEIRGSEALIAEVAKQAVGQVGTVSPQKEFSFAIARPYFIAAGFFTLILLFLFVLWPAATSRLFNRVVAPFANIGNVQATDIVVVPGDQVIAEGDSLRIEVTVPNERVETARLRRKSGSSPETAERMKSLSADENGNPRFFLSIPAVSEDFQYRVHAGGALSRYYSVKVVPRPVVEQFEIVYQYPSYMTRTDRTVKSESGNIEGPVGSLVRILAKTNTKIKTAHMTIAGLPGNEAAIRTDEKEGCSYCEWQIRLTSDLIIGRTWTLRLQDEHDFMNWPTEYTIKAVPDKSPTIVILEPVDHRLRLKATDSLPIHYRAEDDVEVAKTELVASVDGRDEIARTLTMPPGADRTSFNSIAHLELSKFAGKGTQTIKVHLRVSDSLPSELQGPHLAVSDVITITLDETADTYFEKRAAKDYASIREALQRILVELQQADQQTTDLDKTVMPEGRLPEQVLERIDQVRELTSQAEQDLLDLSEVLPSTSFVSLQPEVADLAETDVAYARDQAGLIKLSDTPTQRTEHALASDKHVEQAIKRTEELIKDLDGLWEQIQKIADLQDLADRQQAIAEQIANVDFENFPELPITEQQLQVAQEISETVKATPQVLQDLLQEKHQQAEDLVQAAEKLAEQQTELAQLTETSNQPNVDLEQLRDQIAEAIAREQQQIAEEAAALDAEIENAGQAGEDEQSNLTDKPAEAANEIAQGDLSDAIKDAEVAAEQFEQAAAALDNNQPVPDGAFAEDEAGQPEDGQPQEGQPEGGQPENGQPQEGQPEGGQPENGQPQEGQPEGGQPENGQPQEGQPEGGQPENGQPQEGQPEGGQPENGQPQEGQPEGGQPENGQPQEGQPEGGQPENGQPQEGQPEGGQPENGQPQEGQPEGGQPENGQPQEGQPEGGQPENGQPENGQPQGGNPEQNAQLGQKAAQLAQRQEKVVEQLKALNEGNLDKAVEMIQQQVAEDAADLAEAAESVAQLLEVLDQPQEARANAQQATAELENAAAQAQAAQDQIAQAQADANPQNGEPQNGEPANGQEGQSEGQPAEGQPEGQPAEGQPEGGQPEGQPAEGQPEGGQPEGQPAEGQPEGGQPEGQPAGGQPENGQPAEGQSGEPESGEPSAATGQPAKQQAVQAQQQAAQSLENAARALENLANNLEAQAAALEGEPLASLSPTEAASGELGDALESAAEAIAALQSTPAENLSAEAAAEQSQSAQAQAAQSSQEAAQALAQAAQAAAQQAGVPTEQSASQSGQQPSQGEQGESQQGQSQNSPPQNGQPSPSNQQGQNSPSQQPSSQRGQGPSQQGLRAGTMDNELEQKLKEYGISSAQWTRLPGNLKNQIRQAEAEGVPEEYRTMVRRYFRELARRSSDEQNANQK